MNIEKKKSKNKEEEEEDTVITHAKCIQRERERKIETIPIAANYNFLLHMLVYIAPAFNI